MGATSVFATRAVLHELIAPALAGVGVELLDNVPTDAEDLSLGSACWWGNEVDVDAVDHTMPAGVRENYLHTLVVRVLPDDADVTVGDAQSAATELLDLVFDVIAANRRLTLPASSGWTDARVSWGGFAHVSTRLERPAGFAAGFEIRLVVEATRCS